MIAPYPELQLNVQSNAVSISLPWLRLQFAIGDQGALEMLSSGKALGMEWRMWPVQGLLCALQKYPVGFAVPRHQASFDSTASQVGDRLLIEFPRSGSKLAYAQQVCSSHAVALPDWVWPLESVLDSTKTGGDLHDPVSVVGQLRRLGLVSSYGTENEQISRLLKSLAEERESGFFVACNWILQQSLYITSHCVDSLSPGVVAFPMYASAIQDYIKEEHGHEKLIQLSIDGLGADYSCPSLSTATVASMELLRFATANSFLGLCCCIGAFEGGTYGEEDPLGGLLRKSSRPAAAKGLDGHFKINKQADHGAVGEELACLLPPVTEEEVTVATRLCELLADLQKENALQLLSLLEHLQHG